MLVARIQLQAVLILAVDGSLVYVGDGELVLTES
jgi:hypothetical protein